MDLKDIKETGSSPVSTNNIEIKFEDSEKDLEVIHLNKTVGAFAAKNVNRWIEQARLKPVPEMLFDEFWYETELCILFADTNLGKSILAVQIGDSISTGQPIAGIKLEAQQQKVIYFDFELSEKQFEKRYSVEYTDHYIFSEHFFRLELEPDMEIPPYQDFESFLTDSIEEMINETSARILIVDNLTYLKNGTEKAANALPLMKYLKALKKKYGLSILVLAHTPKRDLSKAITRNDLQGSKMLINLADSCFAIGESPRDKNMRYLKQIKARSTEIIYDTENVYNCEIHKPANFLQFVFIGPGNEQQHLKIHSSRDNEKMVARVKELVAEGFSQRKIAEELGISLGSVNKYSRI